MHVSAVQEATVGDERMVINHLCFAKAHRMACSSVCSARADMATSPFFRACQCSARWFSGYVPSDQCTSWGNHHMVHSIRTWHLPALQGYRALGVHKNVLKDAQWSEHNLDV